MLTVRLKRKNYNVYAKDNADTKLVILMITRHSQPRLISRSAGGNHFLFLTRTTASICGCAISRAIYEAHLVQSSSSSNLQTGSNYVGNIRASMAPGFKWPQVSDVCAQACFFSNRNKTGTRGGGEKWMLAGRANADNWMTFVECRISCKWTSLLS